MKLIAIGDLIEWSGCYYTDRDDNKDHESSLEQDNVFLNSLKQVGIVHSIDETSFCVYDGSGFFKLLRKDIETGAAKFSVLSRAILKHEET